MKLTFLPNGSAVSIYTEDLNLGHLGRLSHARASHVEPTNNGRWTADLSPVNGPLLGPYKNRSEALQAELNWLNEHLEKIILTK